MTEQKERDAIVARALTYLRTPYHSHGKIKGVGVDCLTFLACVCADEGFLLDPEIPHYSPTFMLHKSDEKYIEGLKKYTREVETPLTGDIAIWKFGRCFSHAAIVVQWPRIVHAYMGSGVILEDVNKADWLRLKGNNIPREVKFFSYWGK